MAAAVCWAPVVHSLVQDALCGDRGLWVPGESRSNMRGTRSSVWLGHGGSVCHPKPPVLAGGTMCLWLCIAAAIREWA